MWRREFCQEVREHALAALRPLSAVTLPAGCVARRRNWNERGDATTDGRRSDVVGYRSLFDHPLDPDDGYARVRSSATASGSASLGGRDRHATSVGFSVRGRRRRW
jgi:hypothetical protein